jgi:hypothetical protein
VSVQTLGRLSQQLLLATTPSAGFAKQNATPTILSWQAPNDGQLHYVSVVFLENVTVAETGGTLSVKAQLAGWSLQLLAGAQAVGWHQPGVTARYPVQPGDTITLVQNAALTAGAAVVFAQLVGG